MTVRFYMDEHVSRAVTVGLRRRGLDVLTVQEDGRTAERSHGLEASVRRRWF